MNSGDNSPNLRVFGIAGAGFSGSTLLSFMLGAHHKIFATGEAHRLFRCYRGSGRDIAPLNMCSIHHEHCDFWTKPLVSQCEEGDVSVLYKYIASCCGKVEAVVHSFKSFEIYTELLRQGTPLDGLIIIFKRPVAYYYSAKTHVGRSTEDADAEYVRRYRGALELADSVCLPIICVFYEHLATNPAAVLSSLCDWMGLSYEPQMTEPWKCIERIHTIGGNSGTYVHVWDKPLREWILNSEYWKKEYGEGSRAWVLNNYRQIRLDERWRSMPAEDIREMEAYADSCEIFEMLLAHTVSEPDQPLHLSAPGDSE